MTVMLTPTLMTPSNYDSWHFHETNVDGKQIFVLQLLQNGNSNFVVENETISGFELELQLNVFRKTLQEVVDGLAKRIISRSS